MIALLVGITTLAAMGLGWYGHKASVRIATWGQNMDEQDSIFQAMAAPECVAPQRSRPSIRGGVSSRQPIGGHLPIGAPSK
jgi:hypothetical protein